MHCLDSLDELLIGASVVSSSQIFFAFITIPVWFVTYFAEVFIKHLPCGIVCLPQKNRNPRCGVVDVHACGARKNLDDGGGKKKWCIVCVICFNFMQPIWQVLHLSTIEILSIVTKCRHSRWRAIRAIAQNLITILIIFVQPIWWVVGKIAFIIIILTTINTIIVYTIIICTNFAVGRGSFWTSICIIDAWETAILTGGIFKLSPSNFHTRCTSIHLYCICLHFLCQ